MVNDNRQEGLATRAKEAVLHPIETVKAVGQSMGLVEEDRPEDRMQQKYEETKESGKETAREAKNTVKAKYEDLKDRSSEKYENAKDTMKETADEVKERHGGYQEDEEPGLASRAVGAVLHPIETGKILGQKLGLVEEDHQDRMHQKYEETKEAGKETAREAKETLKSKYEQLKDDAKDKYEDAKDTVKDKYDELKDKTKEKYENAKDSTKDKYNELKDKTKDKYEDAKDSTRDKYDDLKDKTKEKYENAKDSTREKYENTKDSVRGAADEVKDRHGDYQGEEPGFGTRVVESVLHPIETAKAAGQKMGLIEEDNPEEKMRQKFEETKISGKQAAEDFKERSREQYHNAKQSVRGAADEVKDRHGDFQDEEPGFGTRVVESVLHPIETAKAAGQKMGLVEEDKPQDKVKQTAEDAKSAVKDKTNELKHKGQVSYEEAKGKAHEKGEEIKNIFS